MKKLSLMGAGIMAVAAISSTVTYAATRELPWTNSIYSVSGSEGYATTVSVFDDAGNKCYVVKSPYTNGQVAISCLRGDGQ